MDDSGIGIGNSIGSLTTIGSIAGILASVLYMGYIELSRFTGGKLVKLGDIDEELAAKLDLWFPLPEHLYLASRMWVLLLWGVYAGVFGSITYACYDNGVGLWWGGGALVASLLSICLVEKLTLGLSLRHTAILLCKYLPIFRVLSWLVFPLVWLPVFLADRSKEKATEAEEKESTTTTAEDEILSLVTMDDEDRPEGTALDPDEKRMITGALALDDKTVHRVMTPRVDIDAVEKNASLDEIKDLIVKSGHSRIPVYEETIDNICGIISAKDLLNGEKLSIAQERGLKEICRKPLFVPKTKNVGDLLEEFQTKKTHFAVVIDEYGGTAGIVTFEDILEEVVGEIWDEYDEPKPELEATEDADGWHKFDCRMSVSDFNMKLGAELPLDDDYDTFGGYLASIAGRIPKEGEVVETDELVAEVLEAEPRFVKRVRVRLRTEAERSGQDEDHAHEEKHKEHQE